MTAQRPLRGVIDSSAFSGRPSGPMVMAQQIVAAWRARFPEDDIESWHPNSSNVPSHVRTRQHLARPPQAFAALGELDFYLSLNPTVPLRVPRSTMVGVVVHDFRHRAEPARFSLSQRAYRSLAWRAGLQRADILFANSEHTAALVRKETGRDAVVIPFGADHAVEVKRDGNGPVVAICHRENKPLSVALDTWRLARSRSESVPQLVVVGVHEDIRSQFANDPDVLSGDVTITGQLDTPEFVKTFGSARAIVYLSSHEGFGLPVAESAQLGIPVVCFELPTLREIMGPDYPMAPVGDTEAAAALLINACTEARPLATPLLHTWSETVEVLRDGLVQAGTRRLVVAQ